MRVRLSDEDVARALAEAKRRDGNHVTAGQYGITDDRRLWAHEVGCLGECAVARGFGLEWPRAGMYDGDVGFYEVRTTSKPYGDLRIHTSDPPDRPYVLVVNQCPSFRLVGYYRPRWGLLPEWRKSRRPGDGSPFWVPQSDLCGIRDFARQLRLWNGRAT